MIPLWAFHNIQNVKSWKNKQITSNPDFWSLHLPRVHNVMKKSELKHIKSMNCSSVVGCGKVEGWGMLHPYPWNKCQGAYFCLTQHGLDVTIRSNSKMGQEAMNLIQSFWFHYLVNVCKIYVFFFFSHMNIKLIQESFASFEENPSLMLAENVFNIQI